MPANSTIQKVQQPNLESIFNLDCFRFNEMKRTFETIFKHLNFLGDRLSNAEEKLDSVPDFTEVLARIQSLDDRLQETDKRAAFHNKMVEEHKTEQLHRFHSLKSRDEE